MASNSFRFKGNEFQLNESSFNNGGQIPLSSLPSNHNSINACKIVSLIPLQAPAAISSIIPKENVELKNPSELLETPPKTSLLKPTDLPNKFPWVEIVTPYFTRKWSAEDVLTGMKEDIDEFNESEARKCRANTELVIRPLACCLLYGMERLWTPEIDERLTFNGVIFTKSECVHSKTAYFRVLVYHVYWRFFLCVVLFKKRDIQDNVNGYGMKFVGYHYMSISKVDAINNKCF